MSLLESPMHKIWEKCQQSRHLARTERERTRKQTPAFALGELSWPVDQQNARIWNITGRKSGNKAGLKRAKVKPNNPQLTLRWFCLLIYRSRDDLCTTINTIKFIERKNIIPLQEHDLGVPICTNRFFFIIIFTSLFKSLTYSSLPVTWVAPVFHSWPLTHAMCLLGRLILLPQPPKCLPMRTDGSLSSI